MFSGFSSGTAFGSSITLVSTMKVTPNGQWDMKACRIVGNPSTVPLMKTWHGLSGSTRPSIMRTTVSIFACVPLFILRL